MTELAQGERRQDWTWKTGSPSKQERMHEYLEWLLTPKAERRPSTKAELAELLGVSTQTLRNYAKEPWLQRELIQRGRALNRVERAQEVLDSLYEQAIDTENTRSVAAAKVWLGWVNQQVEPTLETDITEMDDEALYDIALKILQSRDISP